MTDARSISAPPRDTLLLWVTLAWIVGMPTAFVFIDRAVAPAHFVTVARVAWLAVSALLLFRALRSAPPRARPGALEIAMAAYVAVIVISWIPAFSSRPLAELRRDAALMGEGILFPITAYLAARSIEWTRTRLRAAGALLVIGVGGYLVLTGLATYTLGWTFFRPQFTGMTHPLRVTGPFSNALEYGITLALICFVAVFLSQRDEAPARRIFWHLAAGVLLVLVFVSGGRGVWLALPLAATYAALAAPPLVRRMASAAAIAVVLAVALKLAAPAPAKLTGEPGTSTVERIKDIDSIKSRLGVYAIALTMIADRPLSGFGFGVATFERYKSQYPPHWVDLPPEWAEWPGVPHSEYLNVTVYAGVFGLAAYLALLVAAWRRLAPGAARSPDPEGVMLRVVVRAGFIVLVVNALFLDMMYLPYALTLFFFLLGMGASKRVTCGPAA